jgi:hypothetical protein
MRLEDIGRVYHYLLKYRYIESKPAQRRARPDESQMASILRGASIDELEKFNQFLSPQGFNLAEYDDSMRGVPTAGKVWVLARSGEQPVSSLISTERIYSEMNIRGGDTQETSAIWFLHIWLIFLSLIYTRAGRGVSEVSGYIDATFSREALESAVQEHIGHIRQLGTEEPTHQKVVAILDSEKGQDVIRRVALFLKLMTAAGLIIEIEKDEYQQTLLGAHEIAENYHKTLRIPIDNTLNNLVNIVAPRIDIDNFTSQEP